jgi:hypothetical protein
MRVLGAFLLALALAAPAAAQTVLIRDGRVVTNGAVGIIEGGDVLIVDGRISAVGAEIAAPPPRLPYSNLPDPHYGDNADLCRTMRVTRTCA